MDTNQIIQQFQFEMQSNGITPPKNILADGALHRFYIDGDKKSSKNGWYCLYLDNIPCGVFGSWKKGNYFKWCSKSKNLMTGSERNQQIEKVKEACKIRDEMKLKEQNEASSRAEDLWYSYRAAKPDHLYLVKKLISVFCARQSGKCLVLPIVDIDEKIWSLQYISETGDKFFLSNGAIKEHFIPIQIRSGEKRILICEGFATGATLAQKHPDVSVIAACNAGNLKSVATNIRFQVPTTEIVICADDDRQNPENPGVNKGRIAAIAASALFAKPKWPEGSPISLKDYNDLDCWLQGAYHA